jgi:hypothetical protein
LPFAVRRSAFERALFALLQKKREERIRTGFVVEVRTPIRTSESN